MGTLSNYATSQLVDHIFKTAYTPYPNSYLYVALCTSVPTPGRTGLTIRETDYAGYARAQITELYFSAASSRQVVHIDYDVDFAEATGAGSETITSFAICDDLTGGNMLGFGEFSSTFDVVSGNQPTIEIGEIDISIGGSGDATGAGFTDIAVENMLNLMFRKVTWATPNATIYLGAATSTIVDSDDLPGVSEASAGNYARKRIYSGDPSEISGDMSSASSGVTTNNEIVTFQTPTDSGWSGGSNITSLFICDGASGDSYDLLAYDNINVVDQPVLAGDTVNIQIGDLDVDLGQVDYESFSADSVVFNVSDGAGGYEPLNVLDIS